jgi:hypothetical protein
MSKKTSVMKFNDVLLLTAVFTSSCISEGTRIGVDFESDSTGTQYNDEQWKANGFTDVPWTQGSERTSVVELYSHSGNKSLQVVYPKGGVGPQETGHQAPCGLTPDKEYYVSYWLRFDDNFSWGTSNEGGKLPGLSGGKRCSGGETCDGTNGFTARFMWRRNGLAVLYLYHMDKPGKYGEDYPLVNGVSDTMYFSRGKWINLMERIKINSGTNKNGEVQVWFNGEEVLNIGGIQFVSNGDLVDAFYFSTFHGGNDSTWCPQNDSYIWFDDIVISTDRDAVIFSQKFE